MKDDIPTVDKTTIVELASDAATGSEFQRDLVRNLICRQARNIDIAIPHHWYMYMALAFTVRDHMLACRAASVHNYITSDARIACCLSAEFLIGPQLACNLLRLDLEKDAREALHAPGQDLDELLTVEEEAGWATADPAGWRLVISTRSLCWKFWLPATAFAMSSAFSIRRSLMAGRWSAPTNS